MDTHDGLHYFILFIVECVQLHVMSEGRYELHALTRKLTFSSTVRPYLEPLIPDAVPGGYGRMVADLLSEHLILISDIFKCLTQHGVEGFCVAFLKVCEH